MVAGEASADMHAAALLREIRKLLPETECFGVGGPSLRKSGMETILESETLNVVGISDWIDKVGEVFGGYRKVVKSLKSNPPDYAVLIDLPDFNLRIAKHLKRLNVPVIYYISPQVWAWRKYRIKQIKRDIDLMLVVFPFEKDFYSREGFSAEFVGHPLLETIKPRKQYRNQEDVLSCPRVALLPGSRRSEVRFHGPVLSDVAQKIIQKYPGAQIKVPVAETLSAEFVQENFNHSGIDFQLGEAHQALEWADVALVASGTATLETALIGTPFALFYKVSSTSSWIYKYLMSYKGFIGMPNLLHKKEIAREFFQESATSDNLFSEIDKLITIESYRREKAAQLQKCRNFLGDEGASLRAAEKIKAFLLRNE